MAINNTGFLKPEFVKNTIRQLYNKTIIYWPGVAVATCIAFTALFLSSHYGGPAFLFALLVGISTNFIRNEKTFTPGIDLTAKSVLRFGVALLGLRIGIEELSTLNALSISIVIIALLATIAFSVFFAKIFGYSNRLGLLIGGATAICGASAALAISSSMPNYTNKDRDTLFTVVVVTTLSTIAMAFYPLITAFLKLNDIKAGFFIGATIHDVAQVVGAGYSISQEAGDVAILTKLLRVTFLIPVVFALTLIFSSSIKGENENKKAIHFPLFLIAFIVLATANSFHLVPSIVTETTNHLSRFLLIMAVAAIGTKTYLGDLLDIGWRAFLLAVAATIFLAIVVTLGITLI